MYTESTFDIILDFIKPLNLMKLNIIADVLSKYQHGREMFARRNDTCIKTILIDINRFTKLLNLFYSPMGYVPLFGC
jgi:hypothetical protein